jgi:hypothetical protein
MTTNRSDPIGYRLVRLPSATVRWEWDPISEALASTTPTADGDWFSIALCVR